MSFQLVTMGSDPEIAAVDASNGKVIPASRILDRFFDINKIKVNDSFYVDKYARYSRKTKNTSIGEVHKVEPLYGSGTLIVDGIAFEINTPTCLCKRGEVSFIGSGINLINEILKTVNKEDGTNYKIQISPAIYVSNENLNEFPKQATQFGCDPDVSIYNGNSCEAIDASKHNYRYFGGHLHMSMEGMRTWLARPGNIQELTMALDRLVGIGTTAINSSPEEELRRKMYGQAGRIRLQPYGGIEYRTPSNSWLLDSSMVIFSLHLVQTACNIVQEGNIDNLEELNNLADILDVVNIINTGDSDRAMELFERTLLTLDHFRGMINIRHPFPDNYLKYARYIHSKGGAHNVFNPDTASERWASAGFLPGYDALRGVDRFVFTEIEPKDNNFLSKLTGMNYYIPEYIENEAEYYDEDDEDEY